MKGLHDALPPFLAGFVRLRAMAADPGDPALVALVTHEQAINAFAELELAGHPDRSRAVLDWYLERTQPGEACTPRRYRYVLTRRGQKGTPTSGGRVSTNGRQMRALRRAAAVALGGLLAAGLAAAPAWAFHARSAPGQPDVTSGNTQIPSTSRRRSSTAASRSTATPRRAPRARAAHRSVPCGSAVAAFVVTGVTNGTTYTCTVHADNNNNEVSDESVPSDPVTPAAQVPDTPATPTRDCRQQVGGRVLHPARRQRQRDHVVHRRVRVERRRRVRIRVTIGASPITVPNLTTSKTYTCTVTAINGVGESNESENSNPVVPLGVPDAPMITSVMRGDASVDVGFTVPNDNGNAITSFTATCTSTNGGASGSTVGTTAMLTVTGLTNARTYRCTARAANGFGNGPPSAPSAQVVPATAPNPPKHRRRRPGRRLRGGELRGAREQRARDHVVRRDVHVDQRGNHGHRDRPALAGGRRRARQRPRVFVLGQGEQCAGPEPGVGRLAVVRGRGAGAPHDRHGRARLDDRRRPAGSASRSRPAPPTELRSRDTA